VNEDDTITEETQPQEMTKLMVTSETGNVNDNENEKHIK